jgi:predicted CXXCH cytochrome family protein
MRIETILLGFGVLSIFAGGAFVQEPPRQKQSLPLQLFSQAKEEDFTGSLACAECHETKVDNFVNSAHYAYMQKEGLPVDQRGCEGCHGPGKFHDPESDNDRVIAYLKISPKEVSDGCLRCHGTTMKLGQWHRTEHGRSDVSCVSCHQIHTDSYDKFDDKPNQPLAIRNRIFPAAKSSSKLLKADEATLCASCHRAEVAEFRQQSRHPVPEGRLNCSDCHDLHPTKKTLNRRELLKDKCVTCHTEYQGPFVFEHDPVAGNTGEGCAECHKAHGSHNPNLLKGFSRGLCGQCHTDKLTFHFPGRTCWQAGCHVSHHGSNTDPRFLQP